MAKAELKTKLNELSVDEFIETVADERKRDDCRKLIEMMQKATDCEPKMWGKNIVGFGLRNLKYASGRELEWMQIGFSPRKANLTLYLNTGEGWDENLLSNLGKYKNGMGCLFVKSLKDIDLKVLEDLIKISAENAK